MDRTALAYYPANAETHPIDPAADGARIGIDVVGVVSNGLAEALERISAGEASTLLVARLADAAGSLRGLLALLDWLDARDGELIALDVGLDTATPAGAHVARVLREVERWEREPRAGRPPRGRPGLAHHSPELTERIKALRDAGESLQAIADQLNDEGVPTPRGGHRWRPSSVQAALGYRRPHPPAPGMPAPPAGHAPRPGHPPRAPGKGSRQPEKRQPQPGRGPRPPAKPRPPHPPGGRP